MTASDTSAWLGVVIQIAVLVSIAITALLQLLTYVSVRKARLDIRTVELATNSMKDALVEATRKSAGLEGEARGREEERSKNA